MSGRLIILPKKSWHVGKRENIEKVLRDERLAEEEAAAAQERAREIAQERVVETLRTKRLATEQGKSNAQPETQPTGKKRRRNGGDKNGQELGGTGQGWGGTLQHVNLFDDAEREAGKRLGHNADHQKEKREQELREQQRSGLAPTALGEGSAELKDRDAQPWYSQVKPVSAGSEVARAVKLGRQVIGEEAEAVLKRDKGRKGRVDPMGFLFRSSAHDEIHNTAENLHASGARGAVGSPGASSSGPNEAGAIKLDGTNPGRDGEKRSKKHKKEKKHKKSKKGDRKKRSHQEGKVHSDRKQGSGISDEETDASRQQALEEMRRKRLAREGGERSREIRLLAEREMAGRPLPDERRMAYNNQYNARVATQNRPR